MSVAHHIAFLDLRGMSARDLRADITSALAVTFIAIPQGIAYAMIAGLPPVMGLYAAFLPTVVGAIFRSSRHVVTGPTNALSLLVGTAVAGQAQLDPVNTALLLALMVGVLQFSAGLLRLGVLVDFISMPVVVGYITGAAVLIALGQLHNITGTPATSGSVWDKLSTWASGLGDTHTLSLGIGVATAAAIVVLRKIRRTLPAAILVLGAVSIVSYVLDLPGRGLVTIADTGSGGVPSGLPSIALPDLSGWMALLPVAIACTVLSLVESSAVARSLSGRSGQRLALSTEFIGQGLANIAAGVAGGYPTSGSPSRSALNMNAATRLAGVIGGVLVGAVLMFLGPVVDHVPIAALAGLLLVVAADLIDIARIATILRSRRSDAAAFAVTVVGTWLLPLDKAIYLGVAISLVFFLRRVRVLRVSEIELAKECAPREVDLVQGGAKVNCPHVRIMQINGPLFFAAAGEFQDALEDVVVQSDARVTLMRMRRVSSLDVTTAMILRDAVTSATEQGRSILLFGLRQAELDLLEQTGVISVVGADNVFSVGSSWGASFQSALDRAAAIVGAHDCTPNCPIRCRDTAGQAE